MERVWIITAANCVHLVTGRAPFPPRVARQRYRARSRRFVLASHANRGASRPGAGAG